ncbi:triacylglycerol esterase/lipase EstA (alpha/beta hydrolase family) [Jatrophihabitans sp. GAS493]|uniref:lipase family alpha/beta hydrolase n=1 Tax=Jatrophihabitans sp. GAS493 TaxID=1907575 RepID=UPI000BB9851F|nr:alpha/beta fold hydrolase [Jatrophihabitans sp. GAS493]SOD74504.1 triacylglycerol esterase/lipase EstA (alpha/beta hydrolase family) [Jatrophihabitans sp. GAS493]
MLLASLSPARRRLYLSLAAALVILAAAGLTLALRGHSSAAASAPAQEDAGPVLLIPGYGGSTGALDALLLKLKAAGKADVQVVNLPDGGTGDLNEQAQTVASAASDLQTRTGARSLDVVGYSAGGVVARLWLRDYGGTRLVRRLVTLGSPQHGTRLADLGSLVPGECPLACQQLGTGSELLTELNSGDETPSGPSYVSIWTTHDSVVLPPDSAVLAGALNMSVQSVCATSTVSHTALPTDSLVQKMVLAELSDGPPVPLSSADCIRLSS